MMNSWKLDNNELWDGLAKLPKQSCSGEDGLPPSLYIKYWNILKEQFSDAYKLILKTRHMPENLSEELIYLIPKRDGPSNDLRKWRLITLLNPMYKILAKVVSILLQLHLMHIVHLSQARFTFWQVLASVIKKKQKLAIYYSLILRRRMIRLTRNSWKES